ncbi:MAG TPA: glycosyltransferase family 9 protein [Bacteroidota bacterium]
MSVPLIHPEEIHNILCIKPRGIGDIVLSTIVLENLAAHFPDASIDYLTEDFAKPAVESHPLVRRVHTMRKTEFVGAVAWRLRREKYDLVVDLWTNPRSAQITLLSGARYRVGYAYRGRKYAYNLLATKERGEVHSAEHNLELLRPIGVPIVSKKIQFVVRPEDEEGAKRFWVRQKNHSNPIAAIVPGGGWASKRCDPTKWIEIALALHKNFEVQLLILWGPGDEVDAEAIQKGLGEAALLAPKTTVGEMAGFMKMCALVLANDSGPMHISAAMGIPTIGIFGPTDPAKHGPYSTTSAFVHKADLHCIVCNHLECPYDHECMKDLSVRSVLEKVRAVAGGVLKPRLN